MEQAEHLKTPARIVHCNFIFTELVITVAKANSPKLPASFDVTFWVLPLKKGSCRREVGSIAEHAVS